ncbi:VPLPA-CTERM sorting domain-containing protein [uncultured Tateyamaria sp.]|uniref:VPLPA-CTERM sorting domain-containing protein n=1 Tax=uncultured Tateyamaria sp. TaxID=455651 RepID=UPI002623F6E7|nr:VPLPA-CTERM sorting domain-containing protein [uncultured Tateyamaria sp.]
MKTKFLAAVAAAVIATASSANAASFTFNYTASFGTAFGTFDGDLTGDIISNMTNFVVELSTQPGVQNTGNQALTNSRTWSLSGLVADFRTQNPVPAGFGVLGGEVFFGDPTIVSEVYDPSAANVQLVGAVPLPASGFLLLGVFGGIAAFGRRKTAA